jgi:proline iminopeptidase
VDFIIGGQLPEVPDFRPRLKTLQVPLMVLAGRYDRALYPQMQHQFVEFAPRARLVIMERSGSFAHIEEPAAVFGTLRGFWRDAA